MYTITVMDRDESGSLSVQLADILETLGDSFTDLIWRIQSVEANGPGGSVLDLAAARGAELTNDELVTIARQLWQVVDGEFSAYARGTVSVMSPMGDPDEVLVGWMEQEEKLFRTLERHLVAQRLKEGFDVDDVDAFVAYSLSVQNRRKARAGNALQNHLQAILEARRIPFTAQAVTENRSTTDFLFPGINEYRNPDFPIALDHAGGQVHLQGSLEAGLGGSKAHSG